MVNGYVTLDLASNNIYKESLNAIKSGKPVMVVDAPQVYFADTITIDTDNDDNVVITKGGKTITINDANAVSSEGEFRTSEMENIVDSKGNNRFVEGDGDTNEFSGVTYSYAKWSLSGTHLMFVLSASIVNATEVTAQSIYMDCVLPKWIYDKIVPTFDTNVELKNAVLYADNYTTQNLGFRLALMGNNTIRIQNSNSATFTLTADRTFRLQFDLLIDAE